ncbi:MAG: twin-arginine translocation pathway signal protein, partial [Saccharothrix sp.]|nr:twin-arginine translocation pathway signal protein [Saccharothrix sp.]
YPEMSGLQAEFNDLLGVREPAKVQMAVRIGRADRAYEAPRRRPEDLLATE